MCGVPQPNPTDARFRPWFRDQWRSSTKFERRLFWFGWSIAVITFIVCSFIVSNDYWVSHAYLLNLASAVTGFFVGGPVVVVVISRIGQHTQSEVQGLRAARGAYISSIDLKIELGSYDGRYRILKEAIAALERRTRTAKSVDDRVKTLLSRILETNLDQPAAVAASKFSYALVRLRDYDSSGQVAHWSDEFAANWRILAGPPQEHGSCLHSQKCAEAVLKSANDSPPETIQANFIALLTSLRIQFDHLSSVFSCSGDLTGFIFDKWPIIYSESVDQLEAGSNLRWATNKKA